MANGRAPSAREQWEKLALEAGEEEIDAAAAVSVADAEAYLAEQGFDVAAERAKGAAWLAELEGEAEKGKAQTAEKGDTAAGTGVETTVTTAAGPAQAERTGRGARSSERRGERTSVARSAGRGTSWIAAAAAAAAVGGAGAGYLQMAAGPIVASPAPEKAREARELRQRAADAVAHGKGGDALRWLDEARALDPAGDAQAEIVELRRRAGATGGRGTKGE